MTEINWNELTNTDQLDELDKQSENQPVIIYKHSTRCSISAAALNRLERKWDPHQAASIQPHFLDLLAHRDVSNEIAARYAVEHESPQLLLIRGGKCVYHTSHLGISFDEMIEHVTPVSS